MSNPTTPFGWQMPTSTDLVTDLPADFEVFGQAVASSLADLNGGTTGQILSKASNADMDFTWTSANPGDITGVTAGTGISGGGTSGDVTITNSMATAIDAKGDIIAGTGADAFSRLAVGSNDQVLVADSTAATGLKWGTPSSGGLTLISEQVFSASTGYSFSSIPSTYKQLLLIWNGIYHSAASTNFDVRLNNVSTAGTYPYKLGGQSGTSLQDLGNSASPTSLVSENSVYSLFGSNANTATFLGSSKGYLLIDNYASTSKLKFMTGQWAGYNGIYFTALSYQGMFNSTSAISSLDIVRTSGTATMSNLTNTSVRLYGVS